MGAYVPPPLRALLAGSPFEPPILRLAEAADEILVDNEMRFFPAFTDHGSAHVKAVFDASAKLVPEDVWEGELVGPADAAVLTGAIYLHDLGLHIREEGFLELVSEDSRFTPLPWFGHRQRDRPADEPWSELWQAFRKEARHFTKSHLDRLLGPSSGEAPQIAFGDNDRSAEGWTEADRLLVGEFIRRHHARLAHEIAIYGFPGAPPEEFPVLDETLPVLADAIGATARSHNEDLRLGVDYLDYKEEGSLQPDGAAVLYWMGVLRIADYFQLEASRASPLLLHLKDPQSPHSIEEWEKHQAISGISWIQDDQNAVLVRVAPTQNLRTHLQLDELIADLQQELDMTTAVLSEQYGGSELEPLRLTRQRVRTNLHDPALQDRLSFVPMRAALRSAEDLFRLVVGDLYGNHPAVAGRELLQNAVDAVRERKHWESRTERQIPREELRELPADVLVEIEQLGKDEGLLRIADRGVGMTPATVIENFLTAGATFRAAWDDEDEVDPAQAVRWMKTGKFGIGVFAAFLLGSEVRVVTRHTAARKGVAFTARLDDDLVQLDWVENVPVGTEVSVPFSIGKLPLTGGISNPDPLDRCKALIKQIASFYELRQPPVQYRVVGRREFREELNLPGDAPDPTDALPPEWRKVSAPGFEGVLWQVPPRPVSMDRLGRESGVVTHNGIAIRETDRFSARNQYSWSSPIARKVVGRPRLAVFDSRHLLRVSLNRYQLVDSKLPFESELLASIGADVVAHALVRGEHNYPLGLEPHLRPLVGEDGWIPFFPGLVDRYADGDICVVFHGNHFGRRQSFDLESFLSPSTEDWERYPFRLAAHTRHRVPRSNEGEALHWGFSAQEGLLSVTDLGLRLKRHLIATVVVAGSGPSLMKESSRPAWTALRLPKEDGPWVLQPSAEQLQRHLGDSQIPIDEEATEDLARLGEALMDGNTSGALCLAVYRSEGLLVEGGGDPISDPWVQLLGGLLERDPRAREERKREIAADPRIAEEIRAWEALARRTAA